MRVGYGAIHPSLHVQGRGALEREPTARPRTGRARDWGRGKPFVSPEVTISARPAEVEDRAVPGDCEGDSILGLCRSAIGALVERTTRFTILLHLPPDETELAERAQTATGVRGAVMGHSAEAVRDAIAAAVTALPARLRRSLTWE
jgi:IS30 family transposase